MFRLFSGTIDIQSFVIKLLGHKFTAMGDQKIATRPISLFNELIPEMRNLEYNPYNILIAVSSPQVHTWALENGHLFNAILTCHTDILQKFDSAYEFPNGSDDEIIEKTKEMLYAIIDGNDIQESIYWSQEMEDKWIDENLILPDKGFFLDIGACHAKIISNTYYFEHTKGWNGLAIDPDPIFFSDLKKYRKCILEQVAISPIPGKSWCKPTGFGLTQEKEENNIEVECVRLDTLLAKHSISTIDLISIDIEGYEKIAWSTFDYTKYNPKVIITEHTEFGKNVNNFTEQILQNKDYYVAHTTPLNHILVNKNVKRK